MKLLLLLLFGCIFGLEISIGDLIRVYELGEAEARVGGCSTMEDFCTSCDISAGLKEEVISSHMTLEQCKNACLSDSRCFSIDVGKGDREGVCIFNLENSRSSKPNGNWDGYVKEGEGPSCSASVKGCIHSYASNYNPDATEDDGSCEYVYNGCASMSQLCTSCDISSGYKEKKISQSLTAEQCQNACLLDDECFSIDFGKGDREGICIFNLEDSRSSKPNGNWDGYIKEACSEPEDDGSAEHGGNGCSSMKPLCTSCDISTGTQEKLMPHEMTLEMCQNACLADAECHSIDVGKNIREGACWLNYQTSHQHTSNKHFDGYVKDGEGPSCTTSVKGCTHSYASNYNPEATEYDWSCEYEYHGNCASMEQLCTSCDISTGTDEKKIGQEMTAEQCQNACLLDDTCHSIDFGKGEREGLCFFNFGTSHSHTPNKNYDSYIKNKVEEDCSESEPKPEDDGSEDTCDAEKYLAKYTCKQLETAGWDVSSCDCPPEPVCPQQTYVDQGYTCDQLLAAGWDMTGCQCEDVCTQVCQQYLDQGFNCGECELAGLECTPCDECGGCHCKKYQDQGYTCEQIEKAGLDCSGCECKEPELECSDTCKEWMVHYNCDQMREFGFDCTPCGCDSECTDTCKTYLAQGQTCEVMAAHGIDCSACDCTAKCSATCETSLEHFSCDALLQQHGLDCSACDCTPKCFDTCKTYLQQGVTCNKMLEYGFDCSACDACSCTQCGPYLSNHSCEDLEGTYRMDCGDCVQCA